MRTVSTEINVLIRTSSDFWKILENSKFFLGFPGLWAIKSHLYITLLCKCFTLALYTTVKMLSKNSNKRIFLLTLIFITLFFNYKDFNAIRAYTCCVHSLRLYILVFCFFIEYIYISFEFLCVWSRGSWTVRKWTNSQWSIATYRYCNLFFWHAGRLYAIYFRRYEILGIYRLIWSVRVSYSCNRTCSGIFICWGRIAKNTFDGAKLEHAQSLHLRSPYLKYRNTDGSIWTIFHI